jgi:hypothetical protein
LFGLTTAPVKSRGLVETALTGIEELREAVHRLEVKIDSLAISRNHDRAA